MDEQQTQATNGSIMKFVIPVAVVAIIAVAVIFFYTSKNSTNVSTDIKTAQRLVTPVVTSEPVSNGNVYKDGTYADTGTYISPGGQRDVDLSVTVTNDVVSDATFHGHATDPTSMRFQKEFTDNYKAMIVGKKLSDIALTKVSGSSLTSKGFTDALNKIKAKAGA